MYYAYFPESGLPVEMFDVVNALAQGDSLDAPIPFNDYNVSCVYKKDKDFIRLLYAYLDCMKEILEIILSNFREPSMQKISCDIAFVNRIQEITDFDYILSEKYKTEHGNWQINKQLFLMGQVTNFPQLLNSLLRLFLYTGIRLTCAEPNSFYNFVSFNYRYDLETNPYAWRDFKKIYNSFTQKKDERRFYFLQIEKESLLEKMRQEMIRRDFQGIKINTAKLTNKFQDLLTKRESATACLCKRYLQYGAQERSAGKIGANTKKQPGEVIRVKPNAQRKICQNCGENHSFIYDIDIFTPNKQYMIASVCLHCMSEFRNQLKEEMIRKWINFRMNNLVTMSCERKKIPVKCSCCKIKTNEIYILEAARNPDLFLCRTCMEKLHEKIFLALH